MAKRKAPKSQKPPYQVDIGDRIYPDEMPNLEKGHSIRHLVATTGAYMVSGHWKMMVGDKNSDYWSMELPLEGFHVVGENNEPIEITPTVKPNLKKGDIVQLRRCPNYPSMETHTAKITGDLFESSGVWSAPVVYNCTGSRKTAIVECDKMAYIGESKLEVFKNNIRSKVVKKLNKGGVIALVVAGFIALLALWAVANFNSLTVARNDVEKSKSKIDTELTRRYDLVDNIVQSVQGSQAQEADVFGKIAEARKVGGSTDSTSEQGQQANQTLDQQIAFLPRLQEAYPELRSNDQVTRLITELQGTNNTIRDARNNYNDTVTNYNNNVSRFPKVVFANMYGFEKAKLFEATAEERRNTKVELDREKN